MYGDEIANRNLKLIYVVSNNEGKIINFKTGKVIRTLDKVYSFAFPLSQELVLVVDTGTIDILDINNKSILKDKLNYKERVAISWNNGNNYNYDNYDFKEFKIEIENSKIISQYIFDIENKELRKV